MKTETYSQQQAESSLEKIRMQAMLKHKKVRKPVQLLKKNRNQKITKKNKKKEKKRQPLLEEQEYYIKGAVNQ
tara:strand:+ start:75 stop:293 length:219 start_codon:yes stop_codon:yes gene_type:complete